MSRMKEPPPLVPLNKPKRDQSAGREREREPAIDPNHWSFRVNETLVSALPDESLHVTLLGGADNGYFLYLDEIEPARITCHSGTLVPGHIVLEIQGQRIAGYTLRDAMIWLKQVSQNGSPVMIKSVKPGQLPRDLRQYLGSRFPKGSIDHDLQQTIRDNLYLRTVPCTTREPRPGEVNGVDYTFLNPDDFAELEKSGSLLESGIFDGNMYGTPKPPKDPQGQIPRRASSIGSILPGAHPSSEGKRRRNRSNTDAPPKSPSTPSTPNKFLPDPPPRGKSLENSDSNESLGILPPNWEMAYTNEGHKYFIDHNTEQTHWLDPRLASKNAEPSDSETDTESVELPYGWEKVEDPHYGTYYIDHVNRKTQYEHPANSSLKKSTTADDINGTSTIPRRGKNGDIAKRSASESDMNGRNTPPAYRPRSKKNKTPISKRVLAKRVFVKNPSELQGELVRTRLLKGERGLGFTIIGGDNPDEEFLQIKNVVRNGPAYVDGKLQTGDVLIHVNDRMVLGFTHQDVVQLFQTIQPGDYVDIEICRGYPLPFDPDDPNTEIITTIAVGHNDTHGSNSPASYSSRDNMDRHDLSSRSLKSLPELVKSVDLNRTSDYPHYKRQDSNTPDVLGQTPAEILSIDIVRGDMGFGFTIADSAFGQKVKQILDRPRCKNLQEGDFIQQINGIDVHGMNHSEVVQVLKECPKGDETRIVIQRGGMPSKLKKPVLSPEGLPVDGSFNGNQPGAYFFTDKPEDNNAGTYGGDGYMNMSRVREELDTSGPPPEIPRRPRTPSNDQRPKTPTENRPKTPTRLALQTDNSRPKLNTDAPNSAHLPRKEYNHQDQTDGDNSRVSDINSRPPPGPRFDPFRSETGSRTDYRGRTNYAMHNMYDRDPYGRSETAKPGQFRSRTPGPELMQRSPDFRNDPSRPKTPTASDMRSKTPIPGLYGHVPGGNPDYARNTQYQNWGGNSSVPYRSYDANTRTWGSSIPEHPITPNMQRRDMSDTFGRMNSSVPVGAGRPPRQSTSFEMEEPSPSNIMRVGGKRPPFHNSSFGGQMPQSPKPFRYLSNLEENPRFLEMNVTLQRQDSGFGFRIIGGTEEGSQVAVGHIVPGGAADLDGRLRTGDEILFCDGICVINSSHHKVVQLMGSAGQRGQVSLGVRRRLAPAMEGYPYDVTVTRRETEGFGFVIISSVTKSGSAIGEFIDRPGCSRFTADDILNKKNLYPWIGRILDNSPAERCGQLHVGDRILAVNGVDISHLHHEDIVNIIKESGYSVTLTVGPPQEDGSSTASNSQRSSQGSMVNALAFPTLNDVDGRQPGYRYPPPPPTKEINRPRMQNHQDIQDNQIYIVDLSRGHRGFGFSIRGGQEFNNMPLFVLRIAEGGAADMDGRLRVGDQLLEINNYTTDNMTHSEAIDIIQNGGPTLRLMVRRTGKPPPSFDPSPSPGARYPATGPMSNGPIGQSSPYLGRRNINMDNDDHLYYNQPGRTYLNN